MTLSEENHQECNIQVKLKTFEVNLTRGDQAKGKIIQSIKKAKNKSFQQTFISEKCTKTTFAF